jgi:cell division septation protein DedD
VATPEPDPELDIPEYSYRARRQMRQVDPAMRRIAFAAAGISVLVIAVALLWSGVRPRMGFGPPPEIAAPATPLRVAPANPGGLTVPGANEQIMSGDDDSTPAQLAPVPPAPAIQQLQAAAGTPAPLTKPAPPPAADTTPMQVQLAATADEAGVHKIWSQLNTKFPSAFTGKQPIFMPAVVNGENIWRLRIGGFAGRTAAQAFCESIIAQGAACTVASF